MPHQFEHAVCGFCIEISRRLVGEHEIRVHPEGASDRDALLTARHVQSRIVGDAGQADLLHQIRCSAFDIGRWKPVFNQHRHHHHVFERREGRDEIVILKNETYAVTPKTGQLWKDGALDS
jgi:hypothetical protein